MREREGQFGELRELREEKENGMVVYSKCKKSSDYDFLFRWACIVSCHEVL